METKSFKNIELPSCAWVLNWSGVAIRNCTKVQLGTKKIIYPIIIYGCGSQFSEKVSLQTVRSSDSFKKPNNFLTFSKYLIPVVITKIKNPTLTLKKKTL
jgi:hypothetical protein